MSQTIDNQKRQIGQTGLVVGAIGMGGMPLSVLPNRPSEEEAIATIRAAYESGVTLFDTADAYCLDDTEMGHNERLFAKALDGYADAVIATKGGSIRPQGRWERVGNADFLKSACEASLIALEKDHITLYQHHCPDTRVPFSESIGALADLQREGKVVHIGISNVSVEQLEEALSIAPIASVQNRLNLYDRSSIAIVRRCEELGVAFLPYSPLNGMGQAGKLGEDAVVARIAAAHQISPQQVVLSWLLQLSSILIPIPGASRIASIVNSAGAVHVQLSAEELAELDAIAE